MSEAPKTSIELVSSEIDSSHVVSLVKSPFCGAISTFEGTTRNNFQGKQVIRLEYEAFAPMVIKECEKIIAEARQKWSALLHVAVHHRIGIVPAGETSIIIAVSSPHRKDSLEAVSWLIDELKLKVPIWKKEVYEDGSVWKDNKNP